MEHVELLVWCVCVCVCVCMCVCVCVCVSEDYRVQANKCCPVYLPYNGGSGSLVDHVEQLVVCVSICVTMF